MTIHAALAQAIAALLRELVDGPPSDAAFILNPGDPGLIASLDRLSSSAASQPRGGRASIAAHVDHLRYGLSLLNRFARGEPNPFAEADYSASWTRVQVSDEEWRSLRAAFAEEARTWQAAILAPRDWDDIAITGAVASVAHLAYHVGAIRQIDSAARGPRARD